MARKFPSPEILQEAAVVPPHIALAVRPHPGFWEFIKVNATDLVVHSISAAEYLKVKEMIVDEDWYCIITSLVNRCHSRAGNSS